MKQLSKLRNIAAVFAFAMLATFALSPKAFAATSITIGNSTTTVPPTNLPYTMRPNIEWTNENTLTLTGVTMTEAFNIQGDITIELVGTNSITDPNTGESALKVNGNLTFTGSGSLTVNGFSSGSGGPSTAIDCDGTITFSGPSITANGGKDYSSSAVANGVEADGIIVNAGVVKIQGGDSDMARAGNGLRLNGNGTATINGGKVEISGGNGTAGAGGGDGIFGGSVIINDGEVDIIGGSASSGSAYGGNGINFSNVTISGGTSVNIQGGTGNHHDGGNGVAGNVTISTTTTPITITGGESITGTADPTTQIGDGGNGVVGNVITPTGTIGSGTNITITGGNGGNAAGESYTGSISQPTPTPTSTPKHVQQQHKPAQDVIYPTVRIEMTRGIYTFSSSGMFSDFSGIWIHGFAIPSSYYTATRNADGTVSVTLADWYVRTLDYNEEYLLHFVFNDGFGVTKFYR